MPNALRKDFHTDIASMVSSEIQYQRANYYYYLGKVESWGSNDIAPGIIEIDSDCNNSIIRSNIVYVKKIIPNDISIVTSRYNWVAGVSYPSWDGTKDMSSQAFFVVTPDNNVYKCLDNFNSSVSTVKPTGNSFYVFKTADGYTWKYMYSIPVFKQTKFASLQYIPVQKALTDSFYNKGSIDGVAVLNSGSGYLDAPLTYITISNTTTGSGATATISVGATGSITSVNITNGGSGYTKGAAFSMSSSTGSGAIGSVNIASGVITGVTLSNSGVGYLNSDNVVLSVGGAVIFPSISRYTGSITKLNIIKPGIGYITPPTLTVVGGGTGKYGNNFALANCIVYNGIITIANIIDPGTGYSADNSTSISVLGDGNGAVFSPVIYSGSIVDVVVENAGIGYTSSSLAVNGAGSGGLLNPIISKSDFISDQSIVEQTTTPGEIYSIKISTPGTNYTNTTVATVSGDGSGCVVSPIIVNGSITAIVINSFGSGYTYASISFVDTNRLISLNSVDAVGYVILPPVLGHGYDAVSELYGTTLSINTSLRTDSILNKINQNYRQFGILKNPMGILTNSKFAESFSLIAYVITFQSVAGLVIDEILLKNSIKYRVVFVDGVNVTLQQMGVKNITPTGTLVAQSNQARTYSGLSVVSYPVVNKYSGKLAYVSDENPFSFTADQGIVIKTFISL